MKRLLSIGYLVAAALLLTACGPIYRTDYTYVPPKSSKGPMCIAQCEQSRNTCNQMCEMQKQTCRAQGRQTALLEYQIYKNDQERSGRKVKKTIDDFDHSYYDCDHACGCQENFNICYTACGGQIQEHRVCTAFCDKADSASLLG